VMVHSKPNLILALLLLNTACPAAGASVMRVNYNGEVEVMQTESATGLANMFSDDLEAKAMASKLLEGTPIDDLKEKVQDLKDQIYVNENNKPFEKRATATLEAAIAEIRSCTAGMENGMRGAGAKKDSCSAKSTSHTTHRTDESTMFTVKEHWKAEKAEKKEIMTTECTAFQTVADEAKSATASYGGGDAGAYLASVLQKFCKDLLPRYREHKEKCTTAKAEHVRVSAIYDNKNNVYMVQKTASDTVQTEMDVTCCEYALATKDVCTSYGTCYKDKRAAYKNEVLPLVKAEENAKKVEWRVYSRIECLLPALGTSNTHEIEKCRVKTHETDHLTVPEPTIPGESACPVDEAFPGTDAYYTTHFGHLPENAKGKKVAECTGMMEDESQQQQAGAEVLPSWFRESDACYLEYCNAYVDLKKAFCCPPGVSREKWGNGGMYCSEDHDCETSPQAASCKAHLFAHGLREGRLKEEKFSTECNKEATPTFTVWKTGKECLHNGASYEKNLGSQASAEDCQNACIQAGGDACNYFIFGKASKHGACWWEFDSACTSGLFEEDQYDIYKRS
jgi:hypothetical protein